MSTSIWCYKMQFDFFIHLLVLPLVRLHLLVLILVLVLVRFHLHLLVHSNVCIESSFCPANAHLDVRLRDAVCSFKSLLLPARNGTMLLTPSPAIFAFLSHTMLQWYNAFNTLPSYFHISLPDNVATVQYDNGITAFNTKLQWCNVFNTRLFSFSYMFQACMLQIFRF